MMTSPNRQVPLCLMRTFIVNPKKSSVIVHFYEAPFSYSNKMLKLSTFIFKTDYIMCAC